MWESLIHKLKLAAVHHDSVNRHHKLKEFVQTLPELRQLCCQLDLDLLAHRISASPSNAEDHAKLLIAKQHELNPAQMTLLRMIVKRMIEEMVRNKLPQALTWLKSPLASDILGEEHRIDCSCAILQHTFDEPLLLSTLHAITRVQSKQTSSILSFVNYLISSEFLYRGCPSPSSKGMLLLALSNYCSGRSNEIWLTKAAALVPDLIQCNDYVLCCNLFEAGLTDNEFTEEVSGYFNTLLTTIPASNHVLNKKMLTIASQKCSQLHINTWKTLLQRASDINDKGTLLKLLTGWITHFPFPEIEQLKNTSINEIYVHFMVLRLVAGEYPSPAGKYFCKPESILHILSLYPSDTKKGDILFQLTIYLLNLKESKYSALITDLITNKLSFLQPPIKWVLKPYCYWLESALLRKDFIFLATHLPILLKHISSLPDAQLIPILSSERKALTSFLSKFLNSGISIDQMSFFKLSIIQMLLKLKLAIPPEDPVWLLVLKWFLDIQRTSLSSQINKTSIVPIPFKSPEITRLHQSAETLKVVEQILLTFDINSSDNAGIKLIVSILTSFNGSYSKSLLDQYAEYFETSVFQEFFRLFTCHAKREYRKAAETFLKYCKTHKLMPEKATAQYYYLITYHSLVEALDVDKNKFNPSKLFHALDTYIENVAHFSMQKQYDEDCAKKAVEAFVALLKEKSSLKALKIYAYNLINYCFFDTSKTELLLAPNVSNNKTNKVLELVKKISGNTYENLRMYSYKKNFIDALLNAASDLTKEQYQLIVEMILISLFDILIKFTLHKQSFKEEITLQIIRFVLMPRHLNSNAADYFFHCALDIVIYAKKIQIFDNPEIISALELYVRILDASFTCLGEELYCRTENVLTLIIKHSPQSILGFLEDLYNISKTYNGRLSPQEHIRLLRMIIKYCRHEQFGPTLKYVLVKVWHTQINISTLLPRLYKEHNPPLAGYCDEQRLEQLDFVIFILKELIQASKNMLILTDEKRKEEISTFMDGYSHALLHPPLENFYKGNNWYDAIKSLLMNTLLSEAFKIENKSNFSLFWAKYKELVQLYLQMHLDHPEKLLPLLSNDPSELLLDFAILEPSSSIWAQNANPKDIEEQISLGVQALEIEIMCCKGKGPLMDKVRRKFAASPSFQNIELLYSSFNPKNHKYIASLYNFNGEKPKDQFLEWIRTSQNVLKKLDNDSKVLFFYSLVHCYYIFRQLSDTVPQDKIKISRLFETGIHLALKRKEYQQAYILLSKALKVNLFFKELEDSHKLLLSVLNILLENDQEYYSKLIIKATLLGWFSTEILSKEKNELLVLHFNFLTTYPSDRTPYNADLKALIKVYLLQKLALGQYENQQWVWIFVETRFSIKEGAELSALAAKAALEKNEMIWALRFASRTFHSNYFPEHKGILLEVINPILLGTTKSFLRKDTLREIFESRIITILVENEPLALRKPLALFLKSHYKDLATHFSEHGLSFLNLYSVALVNTLTLQPNTLPDDVIEVDLKYLAETLGVLYKNARFPQFILEWIKRFLESLGQNHSHFTPILVLEFVKCCTNILIFRDLQIFDSSQVYSFIQRCAKENSSQKALHFIATLMPFYSCKDETSTKVMIHTWLSIIQIALSEGKVLVALLLIEKNESSFLKTFPECAWEGELIPVLNSIKLLLLANQRVKEAFQFSKLISKHSPDTYTSQHHQELYDTAVKAGTPAVAGEIGLFYSLLDHDSANTLILQILSKPPIVDGILTLIRLYRYAKISDSKCILELVSYCSKMEFPYATVLEYIQYLEEISVPMSDPQIRFQAWFLSVKELNRHKKGYDFKFLHTDNHLRIQEIGFQDQKSFIAYVLLATIRSEAKSEFKCYVYGTLRKVLLLLDTDNDPLIQTLDEEFKHFINLFQKNETQLSFYCLHSFSTLHQEKIKFPPHLSKVILMLAYTCIKHIDACQEDYTKDKLLSVLRQLTPFFEISGKLALCKLLLTTDIRTFSLEGVEILRTTLGGNQQILTGLLTPIIELFGKIHYHINDLAFARQSVQEIELLLNKRGEMLSKQDKLDVYYNMAVTYFDKLPHQEFKGHYLSYLDWLKKNLHKTCPNVPKSRKLITELSRLFVNKIAMNDDLITFIPNFIADIAALFKGTKLCLKESKDSLSNYLKWNDEMWNYEWGVCYGMLETMSKRVKNVEFVNNKELVRFLIQHQAFHPLGHHNINKINVNSECLLKTVLCLYDYREKDFFNALLKNVLSESPLSKMLANQNAIFYQLAFIMSAGIMESEPLSREENFDITTEQKRLLILHLGDKWLFYTRSIELNALLHMLINYQKNNPIFNDSLPIRKLLGDILLACNNLTFFKNYLEGTFDLLYDFIVTFFSSCQGTYQNYLPPHAAAMDILDELSSVPNDYNHKNPYPLVEIVCVKIKIASHAFLLGKFDQNKKEFKILLKVYVGEIFPAMQSVNISEEYFTQIFDSTNLILSKCLDKIDDNVFKEEIFSIFFERIPSPMQKHIIPLNKLYDN
jgi:hypothetical protein